MNHCHALFSAAVCILCFLSGASAQPATDTPFAIRGTIPWHNFLSGPTAWNEEDYRLYLDDMAARKFNFVGFHCYTGGAERYAPYVEPIIRMEYRNVVPEAGFDTSLTARWGYRPLRIRDFAFGTGLLCASFPDAEAFGAECALTAASNEDRYAQAHALMRNVMEMAHARGMQVAIGFEFGIHPPEFASIVPPESVIRGAIIPDPTHPANIEILHSELDDILTQYPSVDWVWLWLHEHSMYVAEPQLQGRFKEFHQRESGNFKEAATAHDVFTGVWSLAYIRQAHDYLAQRAPGVKLAIGGWGGGVQMPPVLLGLDRALPQDIVFSCLNSDGGGKGHIPVFKEIAAHRPVWAMPWLEFDSSLWHLQLRASSLFKQVKDAADDHLDGVVAIHWRTEEIRANLGAFALAAANPSALPSPADYYRDYCREVFGDASAASTSDLFLRLEKVVPASPEFYPYSPAWGRLTKEHAEAFRKDIVNLQTLDWGLNPTQRDELAWLENYLRFALLLDECGRQIEAAYTLKEASLAGEIGGEAFTRQAEAALRDLDAAPLEELFKVFARRVRSRGELGELSAINQKLWLEVVALRRFVAEIPSP
ncbi:MAG: hypothetical protein ACYC3X_04565 [Pirellulaceae bacterium]